MKKKRKRNEVRKQRMIQLRLGGYSYDYIGKEVGVSRQYVQQVLAPPKEIRDYIVEKYNSRCLDCGLYVGARGQVHHDKNTGEDFNDIENLILLCVSCHRKNHGGSVEVWKNYIKGMR